MGEEKVYQFNEYVLGYDKGKTDRSALTICKVFNDNIYVMATLTDGSADVISMILDNLNKKLQQKENIIREAREYIINNIDNTGWLEIGSNNVKELLEILNKENK